MTYKNNFGKNLFKGIMKEDSEKGGFVRVSRTREVFK
jgi:hypothetical protein